MATRKEFYGAGSPEGAVVADIGSVYFRTDGGAATTLYVKETGAGNTGWVAYESAASVTSAISAATEILSTTVALSKTVIVGDSAGDIGHADGVVLVAAVSGKIIAPVSCVIAYTFDTAAYTAGGNIQPGYKDGTGIMTLTSAATSLGAAASCIMLLSPLTGAALVNKALVLRAAAAFTDPGTAAGTASVTTHYRLL